MAKIGLSHLYTKCGKPALDVVFGERRRIIDNGILGY